MIGLSFSWLLFSLLSLLIVLSTLLIGSVHYNVQAVLALLSLLSLPLAVFTGSRSRERLHLPIPVLLILFLLLVCIIQMLPLPLSVMGSISPHLLEIQKLIGAKGPGPLSYAFPVTLLEAVKLLGYASVFYGAYLIGRRGRHHLRLLRFMGLTGAVFALVALTHRILGLSAIYGIYEPVQTKTFFAPFVSENHAAGYFLFHLFILLSLAIEEANARFRSLYWICVVTVAAAVVATTSRGGITFLVFGGALFMGLYLKTRHRQGRGWILLVLFFALLAAVPLMEYIVRPFLAQPISINNDLKVAFWQDGIRLLRDHPFMGVGKGGFTSAFTHYITVPDRVQPHYAENFFLQQMIDFGIPAALLVFTVSLALAIRFFRRVRFRVWKIGAVTSVVVLLGQNFFDFNLEFPSTALPFMIVLGLLSAQKLKGKASGKAPFGLRPRVVLAGWLILALPLGGLLMVKGWPNAPVVTRDRLVDLYKNKDFLGMSRQAARSQSLYPGDYFIATARGIAEMRLINGRPLKWIGLGSWLFPLHHYPDLAAARYLVRGKHLEQAKIEYYRAFMKGASLSTPMVEELRFIWPDVTALLGVVPPRLQERLYAYLKADEMLPYCRAMFKGKHRIRPCFGKLTKELFEKGSYGELLSVAQQWTAFTGGDQILPYALQIRALWELKRYPEVDTVMSHAYKSDMRNGFIKATWIMWRVRDKSQQDARTLLRGHLKGALGMLKERFYLLKALEIVGVEGEKEQREINLELKQFLSLGRVQRDKTLETILEPLWRRSEISPKK
ncbi:O-antigen ligase family protein [Myxococcota bacterium]|nr:O-antigen ligase family protein [Myxococcota bacterium]MBU1533923.1 O-antigen ligase family protein [Myxococcota bacterium]